MRHAQPLLVRYPSLLRGVEEERHRRARRERAFVVGECVYLHEPRAHISSACSCVSRALLNQDLVLERASPRRNVFRSVGLPMVMHPAVLARAGRRAR
jgi:hypothetical protein